MVIVLADLLKNMLLATYENCATSTVVSLEFSISILTQARLRCTSSYTVIKRKEINYCNEKKNFARVVLWVIITYDIPIKFWVRFFV
jgi:hypothetical protein